MNYNSYAQYQQYGQAFPPAYNPLYQSPVMPQQPVNQQIPAQGTVNNMPQIQAPEKSEGKMVMVIGEADASARDVKRGESAAFFSVNAPVFYIKTMDPNGNPFPLRKFRYIEETQNAESQPPITPQTNTVNPEQPKIDLSEYVKRDEIEQIIAKYIPAQKKSSKKQEAAENE